MSEPTPRRLRSLRARIWAHFRRHGRSMPWRETANPYNILVSEVMLQQTPVDRVRSKYTSFLEAFPDVTALAAATLEEVLGAWQGLGYNRRAVALQRTARLLMSEHGGRVPEDPVALRALPGIGPATAAAIRAFAFGAPEVFIETNIRRVFIHEFFPGRALVSDAELLPLVAAALDSRRPREWYYALMDYGAVLARRVENPNRRSVAHVRQTPFAGSDRQVRGAILRALMGGEGLAAGRLARAVAAEPKRVRRLAGDLAREGLVQRVRGRYVIAGREGTA